jgi:SAM-dependent methyltransferase
MDDGATPPSTADGWAGATAYESYMGRWSRAVAARFVDWLAVPAGRRWLDVGCGTGALTDTILHSADPRSIVAIDPSRDFVDAARARIADPRAMFAIGDAEATGLAEGSVDVAVSGLVLNFVPDVPRALAEAARVVVRGGLVAAYVWDYADGMELLRTFWAVAASLDPGAAKLDEGTRFPLARRSALHAAFVDAALDDVEVRAIDVPTEFAGFDDLWAPFLRGTGPAPAYVASLRDAARAALRERLRAAVAAAPDHPIRLTARAWAARARVAQGRGAA